jgi:hypothetical protein
VDCRIAAILVQRYALEGNLVFYLESTVAGKAEQRRSATFCRAARLLIPNNALNDQVPTSLSDVYLHGNGDFMSTASPLARQKNTTICIIIHP